MSEQAEVSTAPLTVDRLADFEELFGPRGACAGCWCMWFRLSKREYEAGRGEGNRRAMADLVAAGEVPGLLAYLGGRPVGWCAVAPRERYPRLAGSRVAAPVDDTSVWSVVCFFVARSARRRGVAHALLEATARFAASRGASVLEGYPVDAGAKGSPDTFAYHGLASSFRKAGFVEVARRSPRRPVMRLTLGGGRPARRA